MADLKTSDTQYFNSKQATPVNFARAGRAGRRPTLHTGTYGPAGAGSTGAAAWHLNWTAASSGLYMQCKVWYLIMTDSVTYQYFIESCMHIMTRTRPSY